MRTIKRGAVLGTVAILGASILGACGGSDDASPDTTAIPVITVTEQWARASAEGAENGAAYMTIEASMNDELTGASVDMMVAMDAQVHEMVMDANGNMGMREVDEVEVKSGEALQLKPGGYHVMLMGLAKPLAVGDTITVTLTFTKAGDVVVQVPVLEDAPE